MPRDSASLSNTRPAARTIRHPSGPCQRIRNKPAAGPINFAAFWLAALTLCHCFCDRDDPASETSEMPADPLPVHRRSAWRPEFKPSAGQCVFPKQKQWLEAWSVPSLNCGRFRANWPHFGAAPAIFFFCVRSDGSIPDAAQLGGKTGRLGRSGRHEVVSGEFWCLRQRGLPVLKILAGARGASGIRDVDPFGARSLIACEDALAS